MLVMPFAQFKQQGRIAKSTAAWREQGLMAEYRDGLVVVFVSQRWRVSALRPTDHTSARRSSTR